MPAPKNKRSKKQKNDIVSLLKEYPFVPIGFVVVLIMFVMGAMDAVNNRNQQIAEEASPEYKARQRAEEVNDWYDNLSQYSCEDNVKEKLRDPSSYKRDTDFVITDDTGSKKGISWKFSSKNGFGGYNNAAAICLVSKNTKSVSTKLISN